MVEKYCSSKFTCGEDLDKALEAALCSCDDAARAEAAADRAEAAAKTTPYIGENGNWCVWDSETGAFVDSGVAAQGDPGTTSWNDITDNPFVGEETTILAETQVETAEGMDEYLGFLPQTALVSGEKYTVSFDGVKYECTAETDNSNIVMGNKYVKTLGREGEDTGEPFYILAPAAASLIVYTMTAGTYVVGISQGESPAAFEEWVFELEDGTTVTKQVVVK